MGRPMSLPTGRKAGRDMQGARFVTGPDQHGDEQQQQPLQPDQAPGLTGEHGDIQAAPPTERPVGDRAAREAAPGSVELVEDEPAGDASADGTTDDTPDWDTLAEQDPRSRADLYADLHAAQAQRDEYLDDLRRARAEFENYRRRTARDGVQQREAGRAEIAESLLDALDDLDRTLEAAQASADDTLAKGVELVAAKVRSTLEAKGLSRIDEVGVTFDPSQHEAVQHRQLDEPSEEPTVTEVFRPGYRFGDRVLRAAMVVVEG